MRIFRMPIWLHRIYPRYIWRIPTQQQNLYLSFDDGPDPEVTPYVLDLLDAFNAKATFFCVGDNIARFPEVLQDILKRGHQLGNHTQHHIKGWSTELQDYCADVEKCQNHIGPISQFPLFRPPYGRIRSDQGKILLSKGYSCIMWDILSYDYDKRLNTSVALRKIIQRSRPGSIVVFHDSQKAKKQLKQLLPEYLQEMKNRGYSFKCISNNYDHTEKP